MPTTRRNGKRGSKKVENGKKEREKNSSPAKAERKIFKHKESEEVEKEKRKLKNSVRGGVGKTQKILTHTHHYRTQWTEPLHRSLIT